MDDFSLIKLKNGEQILGMIETESEDVLSLTSCMDVASVDVGDYVGLSMTPTIPFGLDHTIPFKKVDILYRVEPSPILMDIYSERLDENMKILMEYQKATFRRKKEKEKLLN